MSVNGSFIEKTLLLGRISKHLLTHDTKKDFPYYNDIIADGKDAARLVEDLILFSSRDLLVYHKLLNLMNYSER